MRPLVWLGLLLLTLSPLQAQPIQAPGGPCQIELPDGWKREEELYSYPKLHLKILFDARPIGGLSADQAARTGAQTLLAQHREMNPKFPDAVPSKRQQNPFWRLEGEVKNQHGQRIYIQDYVISSPHCVATLTFLVRADFEKSTRSWRQKVWQSLKFLPA